MGYLFDALCNGHLIDLRTELSSAVFWTGKQESTRCRPGYESYQGVAWVASDNEAALTLHWEVDGSRQGDRPGLRRDLNLQRL